jgi:hypothetical protein
MIGIYTTVRLGLAARVTQDVTQILQKAPIGIEEFVRDNQNSWRDPS